ncbi:hypothetical protein [Methylomonas methanica]|nr:hypothetical protein [Methylomonas methanica]
MTKATQAMPVTAVDMGAAMAARIARDRLTFKDVSEKLENVISL